MNRRQAAKGLAVSLLGLTAASDHARGMNPVVAEEHRQQKFREHDEARQKAFMFLKRVGHFTQKECEETRKAVMKRQKEKETEWRDKFMASMGLALIFSPHLIRLPMHWQAIRLCFLLGVDGFEMLQIAPFEQDALVAYGDSVKRVKKVSISIPKIDLPDITVFGERMKP
jgi:hypothetical protein